MATRAIDNFDSEQVAERTQREWYSAAELAEMQLPGLPRTKRKVNMKAAEAGWALAVSDDDTPLARLRPGRGGGLEYHVSLLPAAARAALAQMPDNSIGHTPPTAANPALVSLWQAFERASENVRGEAQRRVEAVAQVERFEAAGLTRSAAVMAAAAVVGASGATIWNWLALVEGAAPHDRLALLAPRRSGGGRAAEVDPQVWQVFRSDYLRPERPTLTSCFERARAFATANGLAIPAERTLRRKLERDVDPRVVVARREGAEALRRTLPPTKRSVAGLHALEMVNIDGHRFDVFVRLPSGEVVRPIMVAIQDIYSRKFLAWRLGETESALLTRLAFADLFRDWGIPKECVLDNGRAFASKWITGGAKSRFRFRIREDEPTGLLTSLGVKIRWTLPYRGQSKPIERGFRDLCDTIAKHPALAGAYTGNKPDAKPENYGDRAIAWDAFVALVDRGMAAHNARTGRRTEIAAGRSFDEAFAESYAVAPIGKASAEQLRLALLTGEQVSTCRKTGAVKIAQNSYWSPELSAIAGKRVIVRFDPDALHQSIHVYTSAGVYVGEAPLWEATGFADMASAKARARQEAELRKSVRRATELEDLLAASDIARMLPDHIDESEPVEPAVIRPTRHLGQVAAALKPVSVAQAAEPATIDRFAQAMRHLRVVE